MNLFISVFCNTNKNINTAETSAFPQIYKSCEDNLKKLMPENNDFYQNRYLYNVNNAFFIRNYYYTEFYFMLLRLVNKKKSLKDAIAFVCELPSDIEEAKKVLWEYNNQ